MGWENYEVSVDPLTHSTHIFPTHTSPTSLTHMAFSFSAFRLCIRFEPEPHILLFRRPLRRDNVAAQQQLQHMQQMQQQMQQMQQVQYVAAHGAGVAGGRQMN